MSMSEQEVKGQIAEMRQALQSVRASRRVANTVRIVAVLIGLCIVAIYVYLFFDIVGSVLQSPELPKVAMKQVEILNLDRKVLDIVKGVQPIVVAEARKIMAEIDLPQAAWAELKILMRDLKPVLENEIRRVRPALQNMIRKEVDKTLEEMKAELQPILTGRMESIVGEQQNLLEMETGLNETQVKVLLLNIIQAEQAALISLVEKRAETSKENIAVIKQLIKDLPPLEQEMTEEEILDDLRNVLFALLKYKLPDYQDLEKL